MIKVKTFTSELKIFQTVKELAALDEQVNKFIEQNYVKQVMSVNDTCTTDTEKGTIGIIRVIAYSD